ncbi:MAG TPA: hypothetical protein PKX93_03080 [bacterium]|nr:hypothetical protein [bacterium]HOL66423.1 hypothetical protein [bacterium]HPP12523.1 hypothetical protein [bacterium]
MNINTKILDRYDRNSNIYQLILQLAERAHVLMSGASASLEMAEVDPGSPRLVLEEFLFKDRLLSAKQKVPADTSQQAGGQASTAEQGNS